MGLALSFPILTLTHYSICRLINPYFVIRGDDCVALWTQSEYLRYQELVASVGLRLNSTKTFSNDKYAVFCEELYSLRGYSLERVNTISLAALSERVYQTNFIDQNEAKLSLEIFGEILSRAPKSTSKSLTRWCLRRLSGLPEVFPYLMLPKVIGGFGFPPLSRRPTNLTFGIVGRVLCGSKIPRVRAGFNSEPVLSQFISEFEKSLVLEDRRESQPNMLHTLLEGCDMRGTIMPKAVWFTFLSGRSNLVRKSTFKEFKLSLNAFKVFSDETIPNTIPVEWKDLLEALSFLDYVDPPFLIGLPFVLKVRKETLKGLLSESN